MLRIIYFFIGSIVCSCNTESKNQKKSDKQPITVEFVVKHLISIDKENVDSIHVVRLKDSDLYITQDFGAVSNMIRLIKLYPDKFVVLDSLRACQEDLSKLEKVKYNYKNDWFVCSESGEGTGDYSYSLTLIRVEKNRFSTLFCYSKFASFLDVEALPNEIPYSQVEMKEIDMNKNRIVLKANYESGIVDSKLGKIKMTELVTFEFSTAKNCFLWKKSTNKKMKELFWDDKEYVGEYIFEL